MSSGPGSREKILFCARDLFYFAGYQSTSVDDILRVCGVAKSNFYYHFRTKDDLALAVLDLHIAEFERGAIVALTNTGIDPAERLEQFCKALVEAQLELQQLGGCPFGNFAAALSIREDDGRTERFREVLCKVFQQLQVNLAACLSDGIVTGVFRNDIPVDELAATVLAAIEGSMLLTRTHRSATPLTRCLPVLQLLLRVD